MSDSESSDDGGGSKRSLSAVEKIARLSSKPDRQLSSLRRLLGLSKLLHYVRPDQSDKAKPKHSMKFISICHEALGYMFNSLFPGKTEAEIYDLTIPEVWAEVERHLSKISVQNPAKLRMLLHTITRDQCSSMKRFTEKVFCFGQTHQGRWYGIERWRDRRSPVLWCRSRCLCNPVGQMDQ